MQWGNKFNLFAEVESGDFGYIIESKESNSITVTLTKNEEAEKDFHENTMFIIDDLTKGGPRLEYLVSICHTITSDQISGFDNMSEEEFEIVSGFNLTKQREKQIEILE